MVRNLLTAGALAAMAVAGTPAGAAVNLGFETGIDGWILSGLGGAAGALTNGANIGFTPFEGAAFGYVQADSAGVYATLSQTVTLAAGEKLKGRVGFLANDLAPFDDDGYLTVNGGALFIASVSSVGDYGSSGWRQFSFTAPTAGDYVLALGVANSDDFSASYAVLDAVGISAAVPEPASWALMILGLGLTGRALRRRRQPAIHAASASRARAV